MSYEVIVVGGGIGGLTAAAVLAKRGLDVCLFERQSFVGGCAANVEHAGCRFDPTFGLHSGWEPGGVYERLFQELAVPAPRAQKLATPYAVRLPDGCDLARTSNQEEFEINLRAAFPECAEASIDFYRGLAVSPNQAGPVAAHLEKTSTRFRNFIDIQLQTLLQCA